MKAPPKLRLAALLTCLSSGCASTSTGPGTESDSPDGASSGAVDASAVTRDGVTEGSTPGAADASPPRAIDASPPRPTDASPPRAFDASPPDAAEGLPPDTADGSTADTTDGRASNAGDGSSTGGNPYVYVSGRNKEIRILELDLKAGVLSPKGTVSSAQILYYLAWTPDRKYMYVASVDSAGDGRVIAFSIDRTTGGLTRINDVASGGKDAPALGVHRSGKWVLASHYSSGHLAVLPIEIGGRIGERVDTERPVPLNTHQIVPDIAGKYVFSPATGPNLIAQFVFDSITGQLLPNNPPTVSGPPMGEPRHMAFHPTRGNAYVVNEKGSSVTSFAYDTGAGKLSAPETLSTVPAGFAGPNTGAHILVHPTGKFVYTSNRGHDSIAVFSIHPSTGRLTLVEHETAGGTIAVPRDFGMDETGGYLVVANQTGNNVVALRIDPADGKLTRVGTAVPVVSAPAVVGIMPR